MGHDGPIGMSFRGKETCACKKTRDLNHIKPFYYSAISPIASFSRNLGPSTLRCGSGGPGYRCAVVVRETHARDGASEKENCWGELGFASAQLTSDSLLVSDTEHFAKYPAKDWTE